MGMTPCVEDKLLGMSLAHRELDTQALYAEGGPLPSSASHPHPRGSHSAQAWLGGSWSSFVVGDS